MSLSANDFYSRVPPSGKTPPPTPSAAFAKQCVHTQILHVPPHSLLSSTWEMQAADALGGRYQPPALCALASGGSPPNDSSPTIDVRALPPTNFPSSFRRARAGTLPFNVQLAAQRFAATAIATDPLVNQAQHQTPHAPIPSVPRPGLHHTMTTQSTVPQPASDRNSRLRSGSLTLSNGGLSNAFGPSIFSSSWLASTNAAATGFAALNELCSVTSADLGADDFDVHTLDYLGLNNSHQPPPAAILSKLRNQAQAAIAGNLANPARTCTNTVSNPYRARPSVARSLLSTPAADKEKEYFDQYDIAYDHQQLSAYDIGNSQGEYRQSSYLAKTFKNMDHYANNRPRVISVGILDDSMCSIQCCATTSEVHHPYLNDLQYSSALANNITNPSGILKSEKMATRTTSSPSIHFPSGGNIPIGHGTSAYLLVPNTHNCSVSPKSEGPSTQLQTPTCSLWIGNLDSTVTSKQLIHVFAPYSAIESLQLLPEKVCLPSEFQLMSVIAK